MLLDRAGTIGGEQARKVFDALQKRFADVGVHGTRGKRAIYRRNEAKAKWSNALTGVRRIDGLLRGVMATRDPTRDGSSVMKRSGPSVISNAA